ncbi:hypothetical protein DW663_07045 [Fusobacterium mortiferum]|uniref:XRE family transcriptional regulator n=1 Tax=Fusobacterium mortiferum TaxID=850 RepID=A0A414PVD8_FUSMR|nr:hypothetical protein [Fusobacterium mortiferum]RHF72332.1 hypothetical protein DW663_07045 [Fusobacterium mortiferum]
MENLTLKQIIEIECIKKNTKITLLANSIGMSRQLMWHHVHRKNKHILEKIENTLNIPTGTLTSNL